MLFIAEGQMPQTGKIVSSNNSYSNEWFTHPVLHLSVWWAAWSRLAQYLQRLQYLYVSVDMLHHS